MSESDVMRLARHSLATGEEVLRWGSQDGLRVKGVVNDEEVFPAVVVVFGSRECPHRADLIGEEYLYPNARGEALLKEWAEAKPEAKPASDPVWLVRCCQCGRPVDTREPINGGDEFGAELSDGQWACSYECWNKAARPPKRRRGKA